MNPEITKVQENEVDPKTFRKSKISWPALFAGTLAALSIIFLLNILGIAIGLSTIDIMTETHPLQGLGTGTIIWWVVSNLVALFIGGMVAGRMSGFRRNVDGGLHGFLTWGLYTIVSVFILASIVGGIVGGVTGAISGIFGGNKSKEVTIKVDRGQQDQSNESSSSLKSKLMKLVNTGERFNVLPNDASEEIDHFLQQSKRDFKNLDLKDNIEDFFNDVSVKLDNHGNLDISVEGNKDFLNKAALKDYLTKNTKLTDQQIDGVINKWENNIKQAVAKAKQVYNEAKEKAIKYADETAEAISKICYAAFFILLIGGAAAVLGGVVGSPDYVETRRKKVVSGRVEPK